MSAHNRPGGPPSGPSASIPAYTRGGGYRGRGGPRGGYRGDYNNNYSSASRGDHSSLYPTSSTYTRGGGGGYPSSAPRDPYDPSSSRSHAPRGDPYSSSVQTPAFRSSNSTSTTYPRTKRFDAALADLPSIRDGGERLPPLHDTAKADRLEEEAARLRKLIDDKEQAKRAGLREWARSEREVATAGLRSELAEEGLRRLNGEGSGTAAF